MPKKAFTPEQIVGRLRQIEVLVNQGKTVPLARKEAGITDQTYYRRRKEYGGVERKAHYLAMDLPQSALPQSALDTGLEHARLAAMSQWNHENLAAAMGAYPAGSDPMGYVFHDIPHVVYRATTDQVVELYWSPNPAVWHLGGSSTPDLAVGDPVGYVFNGTQHIMFRGAGALDGYIFEMFWVDEPPPRPPRWDINNLTNLTGSPLAAGDPMGYVFRFKGTQHVVYRGTDGHIIELYWSPNPPRWGFYDISNAAGGPQAAGDPMGYEFSFCQHVVFRGMDGHIYELYWNPDSANWSRTDLTSLTGAVLAAGDPMGYVFDGSQHVVYRGTNGHIIELYWIPNPARWSSYDLTDATGAPLAAGDPMGYLFPDSAPNMTHNRSHLVYRGIDGHINELYWTPNPARWGCYDLTNATGGPLAAGDPMGYVFRSQHVVYRANDGFIHELYWTE